jgi:MFS family permease
VKTPLSRDQIVGFWAAWTGWLLDGMDSVIYALVLAPALTELLPRSAIDATPAHVAFAGSVLFAVFLMGWGCAFIWGPLADRYGRARTLGATILMYSIFTGAAALSTNVWQLGAFRFFAGVGVGGEWAMAGTYVAEAWPEDRRVMGAGYLQTGYYVGFFFAAALNYTVGAHYGWRAMFVCGFAPVIVSLVTLARVREPARWQIAAARDDRHHPLREILTGANRRSTLVSAALLTVAIIGLWAGAVYEPTAITTLAKSAGITGPPAARLVSFGTGLLSLGTVLGCLAAPILAERIGRPRALALYFAGMAITIPLAFGWAFYLPHGLRPFIVLLFFMGVAGGSFAVFSIWLPELYETRVRATAFAFATSVGRFVGAAVNFGVGALVLHMGTLGTPIALTAVAFVLGMLLIPLTVDTRGRALPA